MLSFLPAPIRGGIAVISLTLNIFFWCVPLLVIAFFKLIIPIAAWREASTKMLIWIAENWIDVNKATYALLNKDEWDVQGVENVADLSQEEWYLVISNHQSWDDILVLQSIFNRRIPFLKFFIKKNLIYVPIIGLAWWALDFPFIQRYSREYLEKHPEKKGKDLEATRKACEKFQTTPISVMNFLEGGRFTQAKYKRQQSPYKHLLRPKAGGIALVLNLMHGRIRTLLNVTIVYPDGVPSFWQYMSGQTGRIIVRIEKSAIPAHFSEGDYTNDPEFKAEFQEWVNQLWEQKDELIGELLVEASPQKIPHG